MLSSKTLTTLATVLLLSLVTLFPIAVQAGACAKPRWKAETYPRRIPSGMPFDATYLQAVNLSDFAAELKAAGWNKLHVGFDPIIHEKGKWDSNAQEAPAYLEPGHHQGMPDMNSMWCVDWFEGRISFRRKDAVAQMDQFCGRNSPLYGKVIKGPLTVRLRLPVLLDDNGYKEVFSDHEEENNWYWLEWSLYVQTGCEWVHDEEECLKYLHAPLDACSCEGENKKMGGAVVNKCYMLGLWIRPTFWSIHNCNDHWLDLKCQPNENSQ